MCSRVVYMCECPGTGSARATYAERKAELASAGQFAYDPTSPGNPSHVISYVSPRTVRRPLLRGGHASGGSSAVFLRLCLYRNVKTLSYINKHTKKWRVFYLFIHLQSTIFSNVLAITNNIITTILISHA